MLPTPFSPSGPSRRRQSRTRLGILGASALVLVGLPAASPDVPRIAVAVGFLAAGAEEPEVVLDCDLELCVVNVDYQLPRGSSPHELRFTWDTHAASGYPDNESDTLAVSRASHGTFDRDERQADGIARYSVREPLWHSDIRCDDRVRVTVSGSGLRPVTRSVAKDVPADPRHAHCSATGLAE